MALNLSSISQTTTKALSLSNLILVSPQKTVGYQPQNAPSWQNNSRTPPSAILFNYEGEQAVDLLSDITDHYVENNTAIQDQIALKPILITTQGFVGELNNVAPAALEPLQTIAEKLVTIGAYTPSLSTTALIAYNNAFFLYQLGVSAFNAGVATWSTINSSGGTSVINGGGLVTQPNQTQQQIYFQQFYGYWQNRTLFTIQTPWAIFQDMAIQSLKAVQSAETNVITDFEITFKLMRFASTLRARAPLYDNNNMQGRATNQGSTEVDLGTQSLEESDNTLAESLSNL